MNAELCIPATALHIHAFPTQQWLIYVGSQIWTARKCPFKQCLGNIYAQRLTTTATTTLSNVIA